MVDSLSVGAHEQLRAALPGVRLVQVVHVLDESAWAEADEAASQVDAVLLDSGNPNLAVKELGGTGRSHDWEISARIRARLDVPVYLAGGLGPDNAAEAIDKVRPFALDVCSGLRCGEAFGLDDAKLAAMTKVAPGLAGVCAPAGAARRSCAHKP